ncbi:MAG: tetratricopeptide repeat protein [Ferrovibrio sp.]|uniref:tetratricopeptide repeat protein n=1 Tax=Ferrovibrio sp. TaxID=1917215 RepID=UPI0039189A3A
MDWQKALHAAVHLHQSGRLAEAIQLYRFVLQQQPENGDALHLLGFALEQSGHPQEGLPFVERAVALNPGIADYRNSLGNIHKALQQQDEASAAYRHALQIQPGHHEAHNNLGLLAHMRKDWDAARSHFSAALTAAPGFTDAAFNLALTDWYAGERERACTAFADLLPRSPGHSRKLFLLARSELEQKNLAAAQRLVAFLDDKDLPIADRQFLQAGLADLQGDLETAERKYRAVVALKPDCTDALRQIGRILIDRGEGAAAIAVLERSLALKPEDMQAAILLTWAYREAGRIPQAVEWVEKILSRNPTNVALRIEYGQLLFRLDRVEEACDAYRQALPLASDATMLAQIQGNLAGAEIRRGNLDAAEAVCRKALELDPNSRIATGNLANIRELQKRFDEAERLYLGLLDKYPDDADAHNNLGMMRLHQARYAEAWPHFAWRFRSSGWSTPDSGRGLPAWDGSFPPPGRLLVWQEQGIGDEILFSSLLPGLQEKGADVVVATDRRLVPLFGRSFPGLEVLANDSVLDVSALRLACQRPFGDLGAVLRPDVQSFASHPRAYLKADPQRRTVFRQRYASGDRLLVGISWNSNNRRAGAGKSVALADMLPFLREPNANFVSLQYGPAATEAATLEQRGDIAFRHDDQVDPLQDIDAQAAQIAALDMVVSVSTAAAHLAAALGVPTLLLLPGTRGQLWYWGAEGETTPWYPSVRICRIQPGEGVRAMMERALSMFRAMRSGLGAG